MWEDEDSYKAIGDSDGPGTMFSDWQSSQRIGPDSITNL